MKCVRLLAAAVASLLLFSGPALSKPSGKTDASAQKTATPPLFRVSDADSEFYLLGTFHVLPPGTDWRSRDAGLALDKADAIWFEAEVDTPAAAQKTQQILQAQGVNPKGVTLSKMLGPDDAAKLKSVADELNFSMAALDPMRPWQAFLALNVGFIMAQGFHPDSGVEPALLAEARARGKQMRFLETVEQQLDLYTSLPPAVEKKLLVETLREWDTQKAEFQSLFDAWRTGDVAALDDYMNKSMRDEAPEVYEVLVVRRNNAWADEIAKAVTTGRGKAVVAVGAGHLAGGDSLPAMLAAKGLTVERVGGKAD
jgi:uncharacterized protein YbaP (TraB family)